MTTRSLSRFLPYVVLVPGLAYGIGLGVRFGADSSRYTTGADALLSGLSLDPVQGLYQGYIYWILCLHALGFAGIVLGQWLLYLLVLLLTFSLLVGDDPKSRWCFALMLGLNPLASSWNAYLLTDGFYTSCLLLSVVLADGAHRAVIASDGNPWPKFLLAVAFCVYTATVRPSGVFNFLCFGLANLWVPLVPGYQRSRWIKYLFALLSFGITVILIRRGQGSIDLKDFFLKGAIGLGTSRLAANDDSARHSSAHVG